MSFGGTASRPVCATGCWSIVSKSVLGNCVSDAIAVDLAWTHGSHCKKSYERVIDASAEYTYIIPDGGFTYGELIDHIDLLQLSKNSERYTLLRDMPLLG